MANTKASRREIKHGAFVPIEGMGFDVIEFDDPDTTGGKVYNVVITLHANEPEQKSQCITFPTDYVGLYPEQLTMDTLNAAQMLFGAEAWYYTKVNVINHDSGDVVDVFDLNDLFDAEEDDEEE